jgi:hypothetical protein
MKENAGSTGKSVDQQGERRGPFWLCPLLRMLRSAKRCQREAATGVLTGVSQLRRSAFFPLVMAKNSS